MHPDDTLSQPIWESLVPPIGVLCGNEDLPRSVLTNSSFSRALPYLTEHCALDSHRFVRSHHCRLPPVKPQTHRRQQDDICPWTSSPDILWGEGGSGFQSSFLPTRATKCIFILPTDDDTITGAPTKGARRTTWADVHGGLKIPLPLRPSSRRTLVPGARP